MKKYTKNDYLIAASAQSYWADNKGTATGPAISLFQAKGKIFKNLWDEAIVAFKDKDFFTQSIYDIAYLAVQIGLEKAGLA